MVYDSPLIGTGLGTYSHNLADEGFATWTINNTDRVHNDLLELAVELGLVGIFIFFIVILSILLALLKILKNSTNEIHLFFYLILVSLIGSFINKGGIG